MNNDPVNWRDLWGLNVEDTKTNGPVLPTDSLRIANEFGEDHPLGIDIGAETPGVAGDPIYAAVGGTVTMAGVPDWSPSGSTHITIEGDDGRTYRYVHTDIPEGTQVGNTVTAGEQIATMGDNGAPGQVHLHYEVFENGDRIDPTSLYPDTPFSH